MAIKKMIQAFSFTSLLVGGLVLTTNSLADDFQVVCQKQIYTGDINGVLNTKNHFPNNNIFGTHCEVKKYVTRGCLRRPVGNYSKALINSTDVIYLDINDSGKLYRCTGGGFNNSKENIFSAKECENLNRHKYPTRIRKASE